MKSMMLIALLRGSLSDEKDDFSDECVCGLETNKIDGPFKATSRPSKRIKKQPSSPNRSIAETVLHCRQLRRKMIGTKNINEPGRDTRRIQQRAGRP